jgi:hypothetical protein
MTLDRKIILGIEDIKAISLECKKCQVRLTFNPDVAVNIPPHCPNLQCNADWLPNIAYGSHEPKDPVQLKLVRAIIATRMLDKASETERPNDTAGYRVLLEFDEPKGLAS